MTNQEEADLVLAILEARREGPLSCKDIALATGMKLHEVTRIELEALKKLKKNPMAWEVATMPYRAYRVIK